MKFSEMIQPEVDNVLTFANLTNDEKEVFILLSKGNTRIEISDKLLISTATIGRIKVRIEKKISKMREEVKI